MDDLARNDIPGPHEVTHEQWQGMSPEERAHAGDASRYPDAQAQQAQAEAEQEG